MCSFHSNYITESQANIPFTFHLPTDWCHHFIPIPFRLFEMWNDSGIVPTPEFPIRNSRNYRDIPKSTVGRRAPITSVQKRKGPLPCATSQYETII